MRKPMLTSLALALGALLSSTGAYAIPIHIGLTGAAGRQQWTSPPFGDPSYLTLSGWKWDGHAQDWAPAAMSDGRDSLNQPGLGICGGTLDAHKVCQSAGETNELDSDQMIDMDITDLHSNWTGLTVWLLSVEHPFLLGGATCSQLDPNCGPNPAFYLPTTNCASGPSAGMFSCAYTKTYLTGLGITDIWVMSPFTCTEEREHCSHTNLLVSAGKKYGFVMDGTPASASVPEPSALGMFGLGALLMGLLAGLRRRRRSD